MFGHEARGFVLAAVLGMASFAGGCDEHEAHGEDGGTARDVGDIQLSWSPAPDAVSKGVSDSFRETRLFEEVVSGLNSSLKFPRNLPVAHAACGEENAFYDGRSGQLTMCYELLGSIVDLAYDPTISEDEIGNRVVGTWMFVFFHELGHALIDMYDLPITGREEDAVDDFSTVLLIEAGLADFAIRAAEYWSATDNMMYSEQNFADEHSLNSQRFFQILCSVYGSDPQKYQGLVSSGILPEERAVRCPAEYQQKLGSWETLLAPWSK